MKISVFYDYYEDNLVPLWYLIFFKKGELPWDREKVYLSIDAPFQRVEMEDFITDSQGLTVTMADLIRHVDNPRKFGLYLPSLRKRALDAGFDYWETEHLIMQIGDIEELLQTSVFID